VGAASAGLSDSLLERRMWMNPRNSGNSQADDAEIDARLTGQYLSPHTTNDPPDNRLYRQ